MSENKTRPTAADAKKFLEALEHPTRKSDALILFDLFGRVTGWAAQMWGPSIIGYGRYEYRYASGREGEFMATGFSPRKSYTSIYIMPGYSEFGGLLGRLGKVKHGKSCLNVNKLADVDLDVLEEIIRDGVANLRINHPVFDI